MIDHAIVAFVAVVTALFICAAAPPIDSGIDTGELWQAAHERAIQPIGEDGR